MFPESFIRWLDALWIASVLRNSPWLLPTVETFHMASYAAIFGSMLTRNLRAFGLGLRDTDEAEIGRQMRSWMLAGLTAAVITGVLLFLYEPSRFSESPYFGYKIGLVLAAPAFEFGVRNRRNGRAVDRKVAATVSAALWLGLALAGLMVSLN
jgi:hypothetical protein